MKRRVVFALGLPLGFLAASLLAGGTFTVLEEYDPFCAACHRPQEVRYVARAEAARGGEESVDLAAAHAAKGLPCVACHRGTQSIEDRATTLYLGARNTVAFVTGKGAGTTALARNLEERSCWACHGDVVDEPGFERHFHNLLPDYLALPQVIADSTNQLLCVDCHVSHQEAIGVPWFVVEDQVLPQCEKCHQVWGRGPRRMGR